MYKLTLHYTTNLLLVPDVFCTAGKPSQSQSTQTMLPNENRNQWNSTCFLYYTRVNLSVLACSHATPKFGDEADLSWFPLFVYTGWLLWRVLIYQALQWMNRRSYRSVCSGIDSWCFMSTPQLKRLKVDQGEMEIDRNTAGQWSVLLGFAWAGSVCYHGNEVYLSVLTPSCCGGGSWYPLRTWFNTCCGGGLWYPLRTATDQM